MQKRFEKLNSFKSQFDFGIAHKRSCPSPPQSKWITVACWCPSASRPDRTTTTTQDDDFDPLACHANHHLNAKTVLGCCGEDFLWHFFGGLHDFRRGTCAFFAVSTLRSRVSLASVHIRLSCRDRDPIKPINWQKAKTLSCVWVVRMRRLPIPHNLFSKATQPQGPHIWWWHFPQTSNFGTYIALQKGWASRKPMCCRCGSIQLGRLTPLAGRRCMAWIRETSPKCPNLTCAHGTLDTSVWYRQIRKHARTVCSM